MESLHLRKVMDAMKTNATDNESLMMHLFGAPLLAIQSYFSGHQRRGERHLKFAAFLIPWVLLVIIT